MLRGDESEVWVERALLWRSWYEDDEMSLLSIAAQACQSAQTVRRWLMKVDVILREEDEPFGRSRRFGGSVRPGGHRRRRLV